MCSPPDWQRSESRVRELDGELAGFTHTLELLDSVRVPDDVEELTVAKSNANSRRQETAALRDQARAASRAAVDAVAKGPSVVTCRLLLADYDQLDKLSEQLTIEEARLTEGRTALAAAAEAANAASRRTRTIAAGLPRGLRHLRGCGSRRKCSGSPGTAAVASRALRTPVCGCGSTDPAPWPAEHSGRGNRRGKGEAREGEKRTGSPRAPRSSGRTRSASGDRRTVSCLLADGPCDAPSTTVSTRKN